MRREQCRRSAQRLAHPLLGADSLDRGLLGEAGHHLGFESLHIHVHSIFDENPCRNGVMCLDGFDEGARTSTGSENSAIFNELNHDLDFVIYDGLHQGVTSLVILGVQVSAFLN